MQAAKSLALGLKRLRERHGLSQASLAERARLSVQYVAALEQGRRSPAMATLDALSRALRVSVSDLFAAGEDRRKPDGGTEAQALVDGMEPTSRRQALQVLRILAALARRT